MLNSKMIVAAMSAASLWLSGPGMVHAQTTYQHQTAAAAGKAILACPKRATAANPNFAELDISTGVANRARWMVLSPPTGSIGTTVPPISVPATWAHNTTASRWVTTPSAAAGSPPAGVYSYWLDFGMVTCPQTYVCTVSIVAGVAAEDVGAMRLDSGTVITPPGNFNQTGLTPIAKAWPGLTGYHTLYVSVYNAVAGETGLHLSGKLRRQCF